MTGKVTVGLASHWPCGTDFSGLSTHRLTAKIREMSTPPTPIRAWSALPFLCVLKTWKFWGNLIAVWEFGQGDGNVGEKILSGKNGPRV